MTHGAIYDALDRSLRELAEKNVPRDLAAAVGPHPSDLPFAGKVVVLAGHWAQTLPIVPNGTRSNITSACLFRRPFWRDVNVHRLTENFRLRGGAEVATYARFLDGNVTFCSLGLET